MKAAQQLIDVATAVADGARIDWMAIESRASAAERGVVHHLKLVERIASVHATLPSIAAFEHSLHDSLLHPSARSHGFAERPPTWGPLTITSHIGSGTYADVYLARDPRLDRPVALKLLRHRDASEAFESETIEEARLLARVRHPNVVTVYGADRIEGRVGIWMEYVDGRTLEQELREHGPFGADEIVAIGIALCGALGAVHDEGLLHRDVKAQNVLRGRDGRILLTDFGAGRDTAHDGSGRELAGTPLYLAPEMLNGAPASIASDIYSLGVLLHHLATGSFPVAGRSIRDLRDAHERRAVVCLAPQTSLARPLATAIDRATATSPADRPATAAMFRATLEHAVAPLSRLRSIVIGASCAAAITAALVGGVVLLQAASSRGKAAPRSAPASFAFHAHDYVLVTHFVNHTGDLRLDGTMDYAFERELGQSAWVNIEQRVRVTDVLELIPKPHDTPIDVPMAREVAHRDSVVRALIAGSIEPLGDDRYTLTAHILNPADGAAIATFRDQVAGRQRLLAAVHRQAFAVRAALGETLAGSPPPTDSTHPLLPALQLYEHAAALMSGNGEWDLKGAERLVREAVQEDPDFASARVLLAWALFDQDRPPSEYLPHAAEALRLASSCPLAERSFIVGSVHDLRAQAASDARVKAAERTQAIANYEAAVHAQPAARWVLNNLEMSYTASGQRDQALRTMRLLADARPNSANVNARAARDFLQAGDVASAESYAAKVRQLLATAPAVHWPAVAAFVRLLPAYAAWLRDDASAAMKMADAISATFGTVDVADIGALRENLCYLYLTLGASRRAEQLAEQIPRYGFGGGRDGVLPDIWRYRKDHTSLRRYLVHLENGLRAEQVRISPWEIGLFIDEGMVMEARRLIAKSARSTNVDPVSRWYVIQRLALADGTLDPVRAVDTVTAALANPSDYLYAEYPLATDLADTLGRKGRADRAVTLLEAVTAKQMQMVTLASDLFFGYAWLDARAKLSEMYRMAGRETDARQVEDQLAKLLAAADADMPIARDLKARIAARHH